MNYTNGQTTVEDTSKKIAKNINSVKGQSAEMITEMKQEGEALYARLEEALSSMGADLKDIRAKAEKTVARHPYYTVLGAVAFGVLAGALIRSRRN